MRQFSAMFSEDQTNSSEPKPKKKQKEKGTNEVKEQPEFTNIGVYPYEGQP